MKDGAIQYNFSNEKSDSLSLCHLPLKKRRKLACTIEDMSMNKESAHGAFLNPDDESCLNEVENSMDTSTEPVSISKPSASTKLASQQLHLPPEGNSISGTRSILQKQDNLTTINSSGITQKRLSKPPFTKLVLRGRKVLSEKSVNFDLKNYQQKQAKSTKRKSGGENIRPSKDSSSEEPTHHEVNVLLQDQPNTTEVMSQHTDRRVERAIKAKRKCNF